MGILKVKELKCRECGVKIGEMRKGKIRKDAILLCYVCYGRLLSDTSASSYDILNRMIFSDK